VASWRKPAVRGRVLLLHHLAYVTERRKWSNGGRPCRTPHQLAGCSIRVPRNWRKQQVQQGRKQPLPGSGAEGSAQLPELAAQRRHRPWRRPHSPADCGGSAYSCAVSGPKEPDCRSGSKRLTARWRTRSCSIGPQWAGQQPAGPLFRLCGWRSQPAPPPIHASTVWWPNAGSDRAGRALNWSPSRS